MPRVRLRQGGGDHARAAASRDGEAAVADVADLIGEVTLGAEGRIRFRTADPFVEGNAVVAACDAEGAILWSWHLWLTATDLEAAGNGMR